MKKMVVDGNIDKINLHGFSAGGAAVVNTLAVLNDPRYDRLLNRIGITANDKKNIIAALQKGVVILECPLKSCEEVISEKGNSILLKVVSKRCKENGMIPIDAIKRWPKGGFNVLVYLQKPDEAVVNRDDNLFVDRIKEVNKQGKTLAIIADDGGHLSYHKSLWIAYPGFLSE